MRIAVYQIKTITPQTEDELNKICDVLNTPSLRYGTAEVLGSFSHWITKTQLKKMTKVSSRFFDFDNNVWIDGLLLTQENKMFAQFETK
jgi:hypothetical protein